jgi:hypothetical protein
MSRYRDVHIQALFWGLAQTHLKESVMLLITGLTYLMLAIAAAVGAR